MLGDLMIVVAMNLRPLSPVRFRKGYHQSINFNRFIVSAGRPGGVLIALVREFESRRREKLKIFCKK